MPETRIHQPSITFEAAGVHSKKLTDGFIASALEDRLEIVPGKRESWLKSYLDKVPADSTDHEFDRSPDAIVAHRDELTDFISDKLTFYMPSDALQPEEMGVLKHRKNQFKQKLINDKLKVANYIRSAKQGLDPEPPMNAIDFHGMTVATAAGSRVDLLAESSRGVRANIYIQREIAGRLVHWSSPAYNQAKVQRQPVPMTRRIYLNPTAESSVGIFRQVTEEAEAAGLTVKGKIQDRTSEALSGWNRDKDGKLQTTRGDGIVMYASEKDANNLLGIVESVYTTNPLAFKGRQVSRVPLRIGEGIAVGDEVSDSSTSLTSHRAEKLSEALRKVRGVLGVQHGEKIEPHRRAEALQLFHAVWGQVAYAAGIDPNNIAFNKR